MTGGAGFSKDASNTSRQNRKLRLAHRDKHFNADGKSNSKQGPLSFKQADEECLNEIRAKNKIKKAEHVKNMIIGYIVALILVGLLISWIWMTS